MSVDTATHLTFLSPSAPIGTILDRLRVIAEQLAEKYGELGMIRSAVIQQRAVAYQLAEGSSATAVRQTMDQQASGFSSEEKVYEADIEALKEEKVYLHAVLKYLHGHDR